MRKISKVIMLLLAALMAPWEAAQAVSVTIGNDRDRDHRAEMRRREERRDDARYHRDRDRHRRDRDRRHGDDDNMRRFIRNVTGDSNRPRRR